MSDARVIARWQPIDTAPKHGVKFRARLPDGSEVTVSWSPYDGWRDTEWRLVKPTHWLPDGVEMTSPILDLATLKAVHDYYEFEAVTDADFDHYLHEEILRAKHGRDLTDEERAIFLTDGKAPIRGDARVIAREEKTDE